MGFKEAPPSRAAFSFSAKVAIVRERTFYRREKRKKPASL
jgi:hypothetical protein